ncbi:MAG TPA: helix-turn-helix domain-containing protein [Steroidobacteraceae bacterium]
MAQPDSGVALLGIGARLRAARERAGLSVIQAAERLHLDPRLVGAMEEELFEMLGGAVYVRGHLRRYAELVGETAADVPGRYSASPQAVLPDLHRPGYQERKQRDPRASLVPLIIIAAVALFALVVWWVLGSARRHAASANAPPAAALSSPATAPAPPPAPTPAQAQASAVAGGAGVLSSAKGPAGNTLTAGAGMRAAALQLRLHYAADSWTEVYDAHGKRLFNDLGAADTVRTLSGTAPLKVVLSHAPGVAVEVDGQAVAIPERALRNDGAQFVINSSGRLVASR